MLPVKVHAPPATGSACETLSGITVKQRSSKRRGEPRLLMIFMGVVYVFIILLHQYWVEKMIFMKQTAATPPIIYGSQEC
jgi:hypothetical protein